MRTSKALAAVLSTSLVLGAAIGSPIVGLAKTKKVVEQDPQNEVDWGVINEDRLARALLERGELDENASEEEIVDAIKEYVSRANTPNGIDTSTKDGHRAWKGMKGVQQTAVDNINKGVKNAERSAKSTTGLHVDNAVVALIEFPDYEHNELKDTGKDFWVPDFNREHYQKMLFNNQDFKMPNGKKLMTMTRYYQQQSAGSWAVDGVVTPWVKAERDAKYYGQHKGDSNDANPRELVKETLAAVGEQIAGQEEKYDQRDPYDIDGDGNVMEPDGLLDNLFVVHSGTGEEAGGGDLKDNAIWSHRWTLGNITPIPGSTLKAFDYIIQPEDGAIGVFCHEYGHNLGLPDEYDTSGKGAGSPVETWSIMSAGSWTGDLPGTQPVGFSPWGKLYFSQVYKGNWPVAETVDLTKLKSAKTLKIKEAVANSNKGKMVKVDLPPVMMTAYTQPKDRKYAYFSTKGDNLNTSMTSEEIDLTKASQAKLTFDSLRDIEVDYDYLYVKVYVDGSSQPEEVKAYSDTTNRKWVLEEIDLSKYAGRKINIQFNYVTDGGLALEGFYVDNIVVEADGEKVFEDGAEDTAKFKLSGFVKFDGSPIPCPNYYLVEYRTHHGVDEGLAHYVRGASKLIYDPGVVIWYVDTRYGRNNQVSKHPGEGFLGVVDAHQRAHSFSNNKLGNTRFQISDAAFGLTRTSKINIVYPDKTMTYRGLPGVNTFVDTDDYTNFFQPESGKILPDNGVKIRVKRTESKEAQIEISMRK